MIRIQISKESLLHNADQDAIESTNLEETYAHLAREIREAVYRITNEETEISIGENVQDAIYAENDDDEIKIKSAVETIFNRGSFWR